MSIVIPGKKERLITYLGEKLRERLDQLESLAALAVHNSAIEKTPAADTSPFDAFTAAEPSSNLNLTVAPSLSPDNASDASIRSPSVATPGEYQHHVPPLDNNPSAMDLWDPPTHIDPSLLVCANHNNDIDPYSITSIDCGCAGPHVQIWTQGPDPFTCGKVKILSFGPSTSPADPYVNNLRVETVCIVAALSSLGTHVGITEEMLCADNSLSPFFQSRAESADDEVKSNTICTAQTIFKTLKPDLRPNSEQITVEHHPYIDILPFPTLRKNLIIQQEEIDGDEFFHDVLTGLVCWGGAGIGRRDREASTGYASTGTPWDVRSWEARAWFLTKYWALLGGEDGELVRQSEWWRSMRGDDTLNMELLD